MIMREKNPFMNRMVKCLEKIPIILIVFLFIGCAPIRIRYHPHHDPDNDLSLAKIRLANSGKNIYMQVGGDWCPHTINLDRFMFANKDIKQTLEYNYEILYVNYSKQNFNRQFLSKFENI